MLYYLSSDVLRVWRRGLHGFQAFQYTHQRGEILEQQVTVGLSFPSHTQLQ